MARCGRVLHYTATTAQSRSHAPHTQSVSCQQRYAHCNEPNRLSAAYAQSLTVLLQAFKDGDVRFMICTDVAARGIDISGLPYVVNMTLPDKSEDYIHRYRPCPP